MRVFENGDGKVKVVVGEDEVLSPGEHECLIEKEGFFRKPTTGIRITLVEGIVKYPIRLTCTGNHGLTESGEICGGDILDKIEALRVIDALLEAMKEVEDRNEA
jgi:hypothetical protein